MVLHRTRHLYVRQMTAVINALRAHLAEFGIVAPLGRNGVEQLVAIINDAKDTRIPELVRTCLTALSIQLDMLKRQIAMLDRRMIGLHRTSETSQRLDAIPGVGPALATALVALTHSSQLAFGPGIGTLACSNKVLFTKGPVIVSCDCSP